MCVNTHKHLFPRHVGIHEWSVSGHMCGVVKAVKYLIYIGNPSFLKEGQVTFLSADSQTPLCEPSCPQGWFILLSQLLGVGVDSVDHTCLGAPSLIVV